MPNRLMIGFILVFWLGTSTWFIYREYAQWWLSDGPPPVLFGLEEEARTVALPVSWNVYLNGEEVGYAVTSTLYDRNRDAFMLENHLYDFLIQVKVFQLAIAIKVPKLITQLWVSREQGSLQEVQANIDIEIALAAFPPVKVTSEFTGLVKNGQLTSQGRLDSSLFPSFQADLEPMPISSGSVLDPLHPLDRLPDIWPGRRWSQPQFNPLAEVVLNSIQQLPIPEVIKGLPRQKLLRAEVLSQTQSLAWGDEPVACWVIEYTNEDHDVVARTWVEAASGKVLRQEAQDQTLGGNMVLQRRK